MEVNFTAELADGVKVMRILEFVLPYDSAKELLSQMEDARLESLIEEKDSTIVGEIEI